MTKRKSTAPGKKADTNVVEIDGKRFSGSSSDDFQKELFDQLASALWLPKWKTQEQQKQAALAALEAMKNIAPRNELEGMLAAQMISTHNAAMECLRRAMKEEQTFEGRDTNLKHAAKLMAIYERQLAALDKHRGKGRQKITVEHVTVEAGGQAIVGEVHTEGKSQPGKAEQQGTLPDDRSWQEMSREQIKPARKKSATSRK